MTEDDIRHFWNWFVSISGRLVHPYADTALLGELDARVSGLGGLVWELGPGKGEPNALALSPGGDRSKLEKTQEIVAQAPKIAGWEFYPAKPPKQWKPIFDIKDDKGRPFRVDAREWRYVSLTHKEKKSTLLIVEAANITQLQRDHQRWAVEIALDGMIGEQARLEKVHDLMVVERLDPRLEKGAVPFKNIVTWQ